MTRLPESSSLIGAGVASILFSAAACEMDFLLVVVAEGVDSDFETPADFDFAAFCFFLAVVVVVVAAAAAAAATDARLDLRSAAALGSVVDGVPSGKIIDPDVVAPAASDRRRLLLLVATDAVCGGGGGRGGRRAREWYPR